MTEFTLPEWLSIGTISTVGTAILGIIFMFIKMSSTIKATKVNGKAQLNLLDTMTAKLVDMQEIQEAMLLQAQYLKDMKDMLITELTTVQELSKNVAIFTNTCFQNSNISAEKKAKLTTEFNNLFYTDKQDLITKLEEQEANLNKQIEESDKRIAELEKEIEIAKTTAKPQESKKKKVV